MLSGGCKWHDLNKDPTDLPNDERAVWTNVGPGHYDTDGIWWDDFGRLQGVIAWCEPKFEANEQLAKAKELLTRFVMASVLFNGKEADLVEEAEQFLKEANK